MKWKTETEPQPGDLRTRVKFAWWPTQIDDTTVVWLESYTIQEEWYPGSYCYSLGSIFGRGWGPVQKKNNE